MCGVLIGAGQLGLGVFLKTLGGPSYSTRSSVNYPWKLPDKTQDKPFNLRFKYQMVFKYKY